MLDRDGDFGQGDGIAGGTYDTAEALRCALALAKNAGWHCFPCREDKRPACHHGFRDANSDPTVITELWRRYPGPLVGVATGAVSNLAVLDLDVKHDEGRAWWFQNRHRLPQTRRYRTKSGGIHCYFRHRPGIGCTAGKIAPGVDTRGDGGYVVHWFAAGYPALDESPPAEWPDWLYDMLHPPAPPPRAPRRGGDDDDDRRVAALVRTVREAAGGSRNASLFWAANRLRDAGASRAETEAELLPAAADAGLSAAETRAAIASAWRSR